MCMHRANQYPFFSYVRSDMECDVLEQHQSCRLCYHHKSQVWQYTVHTIGCCFLVVIRNNDMVLRIYVCQLKCASCLLVMDMLQGVRCLSCHQRSTLESQHCTLRSKLLKGEDSQSKKMSKITPSLQLTTQKNILTDIIYINAVFLCQEQMYCQTRHKKKTEFIKALVCKCTNLHDPSKVK